MRQTVFRSRRWLLAALLLTWFLPRFILGADGPASQPEKIRVLLITGGHEFERTRFFQMFETNADISFRAADHAEMPALLKKPATQTYDVLVLYDMWQDISDETKSDFVELLREGKGLVVLHHALCSYQNWPEYRQIVGGRYLLHEAMVDGVKLPASSYQHGRHFLIHVADPNHPITQGVRDFQINDETYKNFDVAPDVHPLLTTDDPESTETIAWTKNYLAARVFFMQSGHDHFAWDNPNYQRLLRQGIRWAAGKN